MSFKTTAAAAWHGLGSYGGAVASAYFAPYRFIVSRTLAKRDAVLERLASDPGRLAALTRHLIVKANAAFVWTAYWVFVGPIYLAYFAVIAVAFGLFAWFVSLTGWVGGIWLAGLSLGLILSDHRNEFVASIRALALLVAMAVTPHVCFLLAYNQFEGQVDQLPSLLEILVVQWDSLIVWLFDMTRPLKDLAWYWWGAIVLGTLSLSLVLRRPAIFRRSLRLQKLCSSLSVAICIAASVSLVTALDVPPYRPDIHARLAAEARENIKHQTAARLFPAVATWFKIHRADGGALHTYLSNLSAAVSKQDRATATSTDIQDAVASAADDLVPQDLARVVVPATIGTSEAAGSPPSLHEAIEQDIALKQRNRELDERTSQIKDAAVEVIVHALESSPVSTPVAREVVGEMLNAATEHISRKIADHIPLERLATASGKVADVVRQAIDPHIGSIATMLFAMGVHASSPTQLDGLDPKAVDDYVRARVEQSVRIRVTREAQERSRPRVEVVP